MLLLPSFSVGELSESAFVYFHAYLGSWWVKPKVQAMATIVLSYRKGCLGGFSAAQNISIFIHSAFILFESNDEGKRGSIKEVVSSKSP